MLLAVIIFGVLAAACLGTGGYLYYEYARSPQKAWRNRVLGQLKRARATVLAEKARLKRLADQQATEEQAAHDQALSKLLRSISVDELAAYSGIGPGTVGKLRTYGITDLARLRNMHVHIPGLGEKRLTDITTAANDLIRRSKQRFDHGNNPEGTGYRAVLLELQAKYESTRAQADRRAQAARGVVEQLQRLAPCAERINCIRYHLVGGSALVPADVMDQPLPDLDSALRAANQAIPVAEPALTVGNPTTRSHPPSNKKTRPQPEVVHPARQPAADLPAAPEAIPVARPSTAVHARPAAPPEPPPVDRRLIIMELTTKFAFAVIRAQGTINAAARAALDTQMDNYYAYDPGLLNRSRAFCAHYTTAAIDVGQCIEQIRHAFDPAQRAELIRFAAELAATVGNEQATALVERTARQLNVPIPTKPPAPPVPTEPKPPTREDHLTALEISPSTPLSAELIRRQYHLLMDRYQPDKVQHMGPEFVALAESKRAAAQAAALALLEPLGEPLEPAAPPPQELRHNPDLDDVFGA